MRRIYAGISFFTLYGILLVLGSIFIYSASYVYAFEMGYTHAYYVHKHIIGAIIGIIMSITIAVLPLTTLRTWSPILFILALGATAATQLPALGVSIHGARRWLALGRLTIQPGEMLKIITLLYMSHLLGKKQFTMRDPYHTFLPTLFIIIAATSILLLQPDFGQAITLGFTMFVLLYIFELPLRYLTITTILATGGIVALIWHASYRLKRILIFLNPWNDPKGDGFQVIQSLIAIGNGKWFGQGITCSQQKHFYLPMHHTDFIFAIISEETGFFGALGCIILYVTVLYIGYRFAFTFTERFPQSFILGYTILTTTQALTNISVTLGLLPTKGIGLPLISYGNSALLAHSIACGIIINCWRTYTNLNKKEYHNASYST